MGNEKAANKLARCKTPMDLIFSNIDEYLCSFPLNMDVKDAGPAPGSAERHAIGKSTIFRNFAIQEVREMIAHRRPYTNWGGGQTAAPGGFCRASWRDIVKMMIKHPTKDYIDTAALPEDMMAQVDHRSLGLAASMESNGARSDPAAVTKNWMELSFKDAILETLAGGDFSSALTKALAEHPAKPPGGDALIPGIVKCMNESNLVAEAKKERALGGTRVLAAAEVLRSALQAQAGITGPGNTMLPELDA